MPCIQKARKVQSQVLVFCPDPSITFQLRPVPSLPRSSISFPPFPFLLSIYGFLYLPTTSSPTFSLFFPIPEFTFELSPRIYLNRLSISSSSMSLKPRVFFLRSCLFFYRSFFFFFFFFLTLNDAINQRLRTWRNVERKGKKEKK